MEPEPSTRSGTLGPTKALFGVMPLGQQLTTGGRLFSPSPVLSGSCPGGGAHQHSAGRGEMPPAQPDPSTARPSSYRRVELRDCN